MALNRKARIVVAVLAVAALAGAGAAYWYNTRPSVGHGLTFGVVDDLGGAKEMFSHVACAPAEGVQQPVNGGCNLEAGDTACRESRPLLCLLPPTPQAPVIESGPFKGWAKTELGATRKVSGTELLSSSASSARCEAELGQGWRAVQYFSGEEQGFRGVRHASLDGSTGTRYWVVAADRPANCWDSAR